MSDLHPLEQLLRELLIRGRPATPLTAGHNAQICRACARCRELASDAGDYPLGTTPPFLGYVRLSHLCRQLHRVEQGVDDRSFDFTLSVFGAMFGKLVPCGGGMPVPLLKATVVIGRKADCDVMLPCRSISGRHCELSFQEGSWWVRDLGSKKSRTFASVVV